MSDLAHLQANAEAKRTQFERTLHFLESRATLPGLANDIFARLGPPPRAHDVIEALQRNPLLAVSVAMCAGLLVLEVSRLRKRRSLNGAGRRTKSKVPKPPKHKPEELHHG